MDGVPLVDTLLPAYDVRDVHQVSVGAGADRVWPALEEVSLGDVPLFRMLMTARELPGRMVGRRWLTGDLDRPLLDQMVAVGFVPLGGHPGVDVALGLLTRPWRPGRGDGPVVDTEGFLAFAEPGWAKAVLGFAVTGVGAVSVLCTETRVQTHRRGGPEMVRRLLGCRGVGERGDPAVLARRGQAPGRGVRRSCPRPLTRPGGRGSWSG